MRFADPLIIGAGPAGCAAAIVLAQGGGVPTLLDRDRQVGDPLCGGFLSWKTAQQLRALGVDPDQIGAHGVHQLRLFTGQREARIALPAPAYGLSRHALDTAMRQRAQDLGAVLVHDTIRHIEGTIATGQDRTWQAETIFLASGKHDVRGHSRPRQARDPAIGLRLRLPSTPQQSLLLAGAIELHLFDAGYAGIIMQEDGSANICLAVRKSMLARAGGDPARLLEMLAGQSAHFAARLSGDWQSGRIDSIGAVPYGWIARTTSPGLYRLGDQAAVIPSLAGEGISIALASGLAAASHWMAHGPQGAAQFQARFASQAAAPVAMARIARRLAETGTGHDIAMALARVAPRLVTLLMHQTRISVSPALA
ncbi:hypothetical protein GCM10009127_16860 [Alteraurantiacibacter aestuarii]|uniref:FAD-binding domain-containing protein n=1 Tax=Alteraurantiacibacter aestuarii TaxID=650004 RepID=A0A844ZIW4_9SPHN|nr:FAD-dependent monooxygenase [Alteraurantiacibacter aestuarii]MXO87728.1 hypothetical protein [Alteraurantiacibacter aestuarii]